MEKLGLIISVLLLNLNLGFSQTESEIDSLLIGIAETENSKEIIKTEQALKIMAFGEKSLPILAEFFPDSTLTNVKSECRERNLKKGEIAIIMADHIERMPYATLTGVRNCFMTFCENNPNLIEYYLPWINRDGIEKFQTKYVNWLYDKEHLDWPIKLRGKARKERKKMIRERNKNTSR
jgi:hypothetical protein